MSKKFKLSKDEIKSIATGHGGCFASDRIVVDGQPVGFMYREEQDFKGDGGWRYFSGSESDDYANNPENIGIYDVNTIANYDPSIIPFLDAPVGSAFEKSQDGTSFVAVTDWDSLSD
jgi:hypothetical protein